MGASDYNIVVEVLAKSEAFIRTLQEAEAATRSTANAIVAHAERAQQQVQRTTVRTNEVIAQQQRQISAETNAAVQKELGVLAARNQKAAGAAGKTLGSGFTGAFAAQLASGIGIGLVVGAVDDILTEVNDRIEGAGNDAGLGFLSSIQATLTQGMERLPVFGQLMRGVGLGSMAVFGPEETQAARAKEAEAAGRRASRLAKMRRGQLEFEAKMQDELAAKRKAQDEADLENYLIYKAAKNAGLAQIAAGLELEADLNDRIVRLQIMQGEDAENQLREFQQHVELRDMVAQFEERIADALAKGAEQTAKDLQAQKEKLILLTEQAHAMEDQADAEKEREERLHRAREVGDAYLEGEELVAETRMKAMQATSSFNTAGGSFVTQASVGAMNEQKMANKLSQKSIDILTEIEGNTRDIFGGMDLA